jgi:hypothetical protein
MRFDIFAVLGALAAPALADYIIIDTTCTLSCNSVGVWHASNAEYSGLNCNTGCRSFNKIHAFDSVCFDWDNKRAHFYFQGQGKRCLREVSREEYLCGPFASCRRQKWDEVRCSW